MSAFNIQDPELALLGDDPSLDTTASYNTHAFRTSPVFTGDALHELGDNIMPQRAVYGRVLAQHAAGFPEKPTSPQLYINTNAPFSALVCGVQGSGKSHSTSVLLESCLIRDERLGTLPEPLSALVFHFDTAAGGGMVQPCEVAYLATLDAVRGGTARPPPVKVFVMPNNLTAMSKVYSGLPGVTVHPLHFGPQDIGGERLLAMMKVEENGHMPLYMESIMTILRSMENAFDYRVFRERLDKEQFNPGQKSMLNLRLALLDSCLEGGNAKNRVSAHFVKGQLTVIDLSSPFMDGSSACGFFDMILGLFIEVGKEVSGKIVVLDEAHKYLAASGTASRLTESLLTVIRQQRHLATRVVVSTQEPTVVPTQLLDLCSFIIAHRFSSPKWLRMLGEHVSAADSDIDELFTKILNLRTGEAVLFSPNGLGLQQDGNVAFQAGDSVDVKKKGKTVARVQGGVAPFGQGYLLVKSRLRVTRDGGHSLLAVRDSAITTRLDRVQAQVLSPQATQPSAGAIERSQAVPPKPSTGTKLTSAGSTSSALPRARNTPSDGRPPLQPVQKSGQIGLVSSKSVPHPAKTKAHGSQPAVGVSSQKSLYEPLLRHLRKQAAAGEVRVTFKATRTHFLREEPEAYGIKKSRLNHLFETAATMGLVRRGGEGKDRWMELVVSLSTE
ncbi:hypothetical protein OF83DRAFT_1136202 [Amylostereum chailletii]|nr:hypothetical protein OF83DRAFT_1136202 [Amylostereum chailletii]